MRNRLNLDAYRARQERPQFTRELPQPVSDPWPQYVRLVALVAALAVASALAVAAWQDSRPICSTSTVEIMGNSSTATVCATRAQLRGVADRLNSIKFPTTR